MPEQSQCAFGGGSSGKKDESGPARELKEMQLPSIQAFRTSHSLIRVSGPGSRDFLQGQLSADMAELDSADSTDSTDSSAGEEEPFKWASSLLLGPEGKLVAEIRVMRPSESMLGLSGDDYILETQTGFGEKVMERLQRFSIGANCEMRAGKCSGIALLAPVTAGENLVVVDAESPQETLEGKYPILEASWTDDIVWVQLLGTEPEMKLLQHPNMEIPFGSENDFEFWRILSGIPRMGNELLEGIIPAIAGQKFIAKNVSFTKGCFVGQELVARIDSRGAKTPKQLVGIAIQNSGAGDHEGVQEAGGTEKFEGEITSLAAIPDNLPEILKSQQEEIIGMAYMGRNFAGEGTFELLPENLPERYRSILDFKGLDFEGGALKLRAFSLP